jgi:hypothetical protein
VSAWEHVMADQPRVGSMLYEWPERHVDRDADRED